MKPYPASFPSTAIFSGMSREEIESILHCLGASQEVFPKGCAIFRAGDETESMGLVLSGNVLVIQEDLWGHRSIMDMIVPGDSFGEIFAASPGSILNVSVIADSDCQILMMNLKRILSVCPSSCSHHRKLIQNLVSSLAKKALRFNHKITHMSKRSTREKLLSFLSAESIQHGSLCFPISYNRQQLADYLCVDRAAMCVALSALQEEGLISYEKNRFTLHITAAEGQ